MGWGVCVADSQRAGILLKTCKYVGPVLALSVTKCMWHLWLSGVDQGHKLVFCPRPRGTQIRKWYDMLVISDCFQTADWFFLIENKTWQRSLNSCYFYYHVNSNNVFFSVEKTINFSSKHRLLQNPLRPRQFVLFSKPWHPPICLPPLFWIVLFLNTRRCRRLPKLSSSRFPEQLLQNPWPWDCQWTRL